MSGYSWLDSLVDLDLESISEQINKSVEEASRIIDEVNNLEILNLDAMAVKQEEEEKLQEDDYEEDIEEITNAYDDVHLEQKQPAVTNNVETIPVSTFRIRKLENDDEQNWSTDFSFNGDRQHNQEEISTPNNEIRPPLESINDEATSYDLSENARILFSELAIPDLPESPNKVEVDFAPRDIIVPSTLKSGLLLPKSVNVETRGDNIQDEFSNRPSKKKRKKKKRRDKTNGLDFWGLSSTDEAADQSDNHIDIENQGLLSESSTIATAIESVGDIAQKLPQRIMSGFLGGQLTNYNYSFFDNIEEEIDLDDDPILRTVEDNKLRPATKPSTQQSISDTLNEWSSYAYSNETTPPVSDFHVNSSLQSGNEPISIRSICKWLADWCIRCFIPSVFKGAVWLFKKLLEWMLYFYDSTRSYLFRTETLQRNECNIREVSFVTVRRFAVLAWENISSVYGLSVLTGILFLASYYKFRRYGTDAGQ